MTHICISKVTITGSDNGLSPGRRQAIIWINAWILLIGPLGTNFSEILFEIYTFSFKKMHLKMSPGKWRPSCLGLNVLNNSNSFSTNCPFDPCCINCIKWDDDGVIHVQHGNNAPKMFSGHLRFTAAYHIFAGKISKNYVTLFITVTNCNLPQAELSINHKQCIWYTVCKMSSNIQAPNTLGNTKIHLEINTCPAVRGLSLHSLIFNKISARCIFEDFDVRCRYLWLG